MDILSVYFYFTYTILFQKVIFLDIATFHFIYIFYPFTSRKWFSISLKFSYIIFTYHI